MDVVFADGGGVVEPVLAGVIEEVVLFFRFRSGRRSDRFLDGRRGGRLVLFVVLLMIWLVILFSVLLVPLLMVLL